MAIPHHDLFATTRWTIVLNASDRERDEAASALEELCRIYWLPLYAYARGRGYGREDAEDMTQGFLAHIIDQTRLGRADRAKAQFRCFLLASFKHYMVNDYHKSHAQRRGGDCRHIPLDWEHKTACLQVPDPSACSPETIFDREWALALLERVLDVLQSEWESKPRPVAFDVLRPFLTPEGVEEGYAEAYSATGIPKENLRVYAHRLRKRYRDLLKEEIGRTLFSPDMIAEELETLKKAFA